jgi:hypothetical protein
VNPRESADGEADPERHDEQQQQHPLVLVAGHCDEVGGRIAEERAQDRGDGGDPYRLPQEHVVETVGEEFAPVGGGVDFLFHPCCHELVEREDQHDDDGQDHQKHERYKRR